MNPAMLASAVLLAALAVAARLDAGRRLPHAYAAASLFACAALAMGFLAVPAETAARSTVISYAGAVLLLAAAVSSVLNSRRGDMRRILIVGGALGWSAATASASFVRTTDVAVLAPVAAGACVGATVLIAVALARDSRTHHRWLHEVVFDALVVGVAAGAVSTILTSGRPADSPFAALDTTAFVVAPTLAAVLLTYCLQVVIGRGMDSPTYKLLIGAFALVTIGGIGSLPALSDELTAESAVMVQAAGALLACIPLVYVCSPPKERAVERVGLARTLRSSSFLVFATAIIGTVIVGAIETLRGYHVPPWLVISASIAATSLAAIRVAHLLSALHSSTQSQFDAVTLDPLTGLPNRSWFTRKVSNALTDMAEERRFAGALYICDLDDFKDVNDSLGHTTGDLVLVEVADRLCAVSPDTATVGRLSGDEFAIWIPGVSGLDEAEVFAQAISGSLLDPIPLGRRQVEFSGSIGVALADVSCGYDMTELLRRADVAMYYAKRSGKNRCEVYNETMRDAAADRLELTVALRDAITNGEFVVHFQPLWTIDGNTVTSLEALVRWDRPGVGLVPPDRFLPAAQTSGLMFDIGEIVLDTSLAALKRLRAINPLLTVAVNASVSQLSDSLFATMVAERLAQHGLDGEALTIELTETDVVLDFSRIAACVEQLRQLGVRIAIDDFGSGYSSVRYLRDFTPDVVKIDREIIDEIDSDEASVGLIRGVLALAGSAGASCVAEGVERDSQRRQLDALGCELGQGWLYARAVPENELEQVLRSWGTRTSAPADAS